MARRLRTQLTKAGEEKHSGSASPDKAADGESAPNRAGIGYSVPPPTHKRSGLTGIVLEETNDHALVHPQKSCGVSRPRGESIDKWSC